MRWAPADSVLLLGPPRIRLLLLRVGLRFTITRPQTPITFCGAIVEWSEIPSGPNVTAKHGWSFLAGSPAISTVRSLA
jgi:hypothetical protein